MTESEGRSESRDKPAKKQKWERPAIKSERLFETYALACDKEDPGSDQCVYKGAFTS